MRVHLCTLHLHAYIQTNTNTCQHAQRLSTTASSSTSKCTNPPQSTWSTKSQKTKTSCMCCTPSASSASLDQGRRCWVMVWSSWRKIICTCIMMATSRWQRSRKTCECVFVYAYTRILHKYVYTYIQRSMAVGQIRENSCFTWYAYIHTYTLRKCVRTNVHACIPTYIPTCIYVCIPKCMHACMYSHMYACM